jgi:hypothetical protein
LAEVDNREPFATHILQTQPHLDRRLIRRLRNNYWNAFKHFYDQKGLQRQDEELLADFNDTKNDAALYIGWRLLLVAPAAIVTRAPSAGTNVGECYPQMELWNCLGVPACGLPSINEKLPPRIAGKRPGPEAA